MGKLLSFEGLVHFLDRLRTEVSRKIFEHKYSLFSGETLILKDNNGNTESIIEENEFGMATTSFEYPDDTTSIITVILEPISGNWNYTKTITISSDTSGSKTIVESFTKTAK